MTQTVSSDLSYPVGKFAEPDAYTPERRRLYIEQIAALPANLRAAVAGWDDARLDEPYRPGGWTVRQLLHHVPDSHLNAYVRFKLALTEDEPTIKPYDQDRWSQMADTRVTPVEVSLALLDAVHVRWVNVLRAMSAADFQRAYFHPELGHRVPLDYALAMYAWHSRHHLAHVTELKRRKGW